METSYGVVWREGSRPPITGKLELLPRAMHLNGLSSSSQVPYDGVSAVRLGRVAGDRINGHRSVVVERRAGHPITITTVARPSEVGEIAERLAALRSNTQTSRRVVVILPIKADARPRVRELLKAGPPFDPDAIAGLEQHEAFLTAGEAVFVFASPLGPDALASRLADAGLSEAAASWSDFVAGPPRIAELVFAWARGPAAGDVSYLPTPGPGDSDGGDVF